MESGVTRDRYNSIEKLSQATPWDFKALPVDYSPSRYRLEAAGLLEESEVSIWIPTYYFFLKDMAFEDVDMKRTSIYLSDSMYNIREKSKASHFAGSFLYYTFGLYRN